MRNEMKKLLTLSTAFLIAAVLIISSNIASSQRTEELTKFTKGEWGELWSAGFGKVRAVAYSPDGSKLAVGGDTADISIISTSTYELERQLIGHRDRVRCVVWSQDSSKIIAGSDDGTVKIWSVATGEELKALEHYGTITAIALSSNQQYLATGTGRYERIVRIFNYKTGELLRELKGFDDAITALAFSPDCEKLACAVGNPEDAAHDSVIQIFELSSNKLLHEIEAHENGVECIDWSFDNFIVSGGQDNTIKIWDGNTYELVATLKSHEAKVNKALWSKDSKRVLSCSDDKTIKLWDVAKKEVLKNFVDDGMVKTVDFSIDGEHFASGSDICKVKIWDIAYTSPERELYGHTSTVRAVAWSPDGSKIASGSTDTTIIIWSVETGKMLKRIDAGSAVYSLDWSPDGTRIVSGHGDSMIKVWSAYGNLINQWQGSNWGWVNDVAWSPDCKYIASASQDGRPTHGRPVGLRVWYPDGTLKCELKGHFEIVREASWAPNGTLLVSASDDRTLRVWNVETEELLYYIFYPDSFFYSCAWSPDGGKIAGGTYSSIRVYDSQLNFITSLGPLSRGVLALDWWQDSDKLASGTDSELKIWSASKNKCLSGLPVPLTSSDYVYDIRWHQSNKIASCDHGGAVRLWRPVIGIEATARSKVLSGAQVPLEIRTFHYDSTIADADITISSELGTLSKNSGKSDRDGKFTSIFYAPETEQNITSQIKITVSKPDSVYADNKLMFTVYIYPRVLIPELKAPSELESKRTSTFILLVSDYIAPAPNATVNVSSDYGAVEPAQAKTDENGTVKIIFTAPETSSKKISTIKVTVFKEGYPTAVKYFYITILPKKEAPFAIDLLIYCLLFIIPPVTGIVIALGILRKKH
ncbi:MAG: hypothetical protein QME47_01965 [Candidatus Thermoplasmatota archaeon]|nr:hypothetical protein [Candidatus Thermoplasmatota archaeon]